MRAVVRKFVNKLWEQRKVYSQLQISNCCNCDTESVLSLYTSNIINVAYLVLDYCDIDSVVYIAEPFLKSLCLVVNQRSVHVPPLFLRLVQRIDESRTGFFWHVLLDVIFQCLRYTENAFDLIQPNLVTNLILQHVRK